MAQDAINGNGLQQLWRGEDRGALQNIDLRSWLRFLLLGPPDILVPIKDYTAEQLCSLNGLNESPLSFLR
jgi:hypothetical protein